MITTLLFSTFLHFSIVEGSIGIGIEESGTFEPTLYGNVGTIEVGNKIISLDLSAAEGAICKGEIGGIFIPKISLLLLKKQRLTTNFIFSLTPYIGLFETGWYYLNTIELKYKEYIIKTGIIGEEYADDIESYNLTDIFPLITKEAHDGAYFISFGIKI